MSNFFPNSLIFGMLLGLPALTVLFVAIIYTIDPVGYVSQLTAECFGSLIAVIATVSIVEWFLIYQRQRQWGRVRGMTANAVANQLCEVASDFYRCFGIKEQKYVETILNCQNVPNEATLRDYTEFVERIRKLHTRVDNDKSISDASARFYDEATWNLDQIQTVLMPRVMQSASEQKFIDALVHHDEARRALHLAVVRYKKGIITNGVYPKVVDLLDRSRELYEVLCENGRNGKKAKKARKAKGLEDSLATLKARHRGAEMPA